jgi:hypothetical protein
METNQSNLPTVDKTNPQNPSESKKENNTENPIANTNQQQPLEKINQQKDAPGISKKITDTPDKEEKKDDRVEGEKGSKMPTPDTMKEQVQE